MLAVAVPPSIKLAVGSKVITIQNTMIAQPELQQLLSLLLEEKLQIAQQLIERILKGIHSNKHGQAAKAVLR